MSSDHVIISYSIFINIVLNNIIRPRVMAFVKKDNANHMIIISKLDIC